MKGVLNSKSLRISGVIVYWQGEEGLSGNTDGFGEEPQRTADMMSYHQTLSQREDWVICLFICLQVNANRKVGGTASTERLTLEGNWVIYFNFNIVNNFRNWCHNLIFNAKALQAILFCDWAWLQTVISHLSIPTLLVWYRPLC